MTAACTETGGATPPLALQTSLVDAAMHNGFDVHRPLHMDAGLEGDAVRFGHDRRPRTSLLPGAGLGLRNLDERCRLLSGRGLLIEGGGDRFEVVVPLVRR